MIRNSASAYSSWFEWQLARQQQLRPRPLGYLLDQPAEHSCRGA